MSSDCDLLHAALYNMGGQAIADKIQTNSSGSDCCTLLTSGGWGKCNGASITELYLSNSNQIKYTIDGRLGQLRSLTHLDLSHNTITGGIGVLTSLTSLNFLDISFNHLNAPLPGLSGMSSLLTLNVGNNPSIPNNGFPSSLPPNLNSLNLQTTVILAQVQASELPGSLTNCQIQTNNICEVGGNNACFPACPNQPNPNPNPGGGGSTTAAGGGGGQQTTTTQGQAGGSTTTTTSGSSQSGGSSTSTSSGGIITTSLGGGSSTLGGSPGVSTGSPSSPSSSNGSSSLSSSGGGNSTSTSSSSPLLIVSVIASLLFLVVVSLGVMWFVRRKRRQVTKELEGLKREREEEEGWRKDENDGLDDDDDFFPVFGKGKNVGGGVDEYLSGKGPASTMKLRIRRKLEGKGGCGAVYLATYGNLPAVAKIPIVKEHDALIYQEMELISKLASDWTVRTLAYLDGVELFLPDQVDTLPRCALVLEFMNLGALQDHLKVKGPTPPASPLQSPDKSPSPSKVSSSMMASSVSTTTGFEPISLSDRVLAQRASIAIQTAQGLAYIHEQGMVHLDIKAGNVLLNIDERTMEIRAKLSDFGSVVPINAVRKVLQTPGYYPPESSASHPKTTKFDSYGFGMLLVNMICLQNIPYFWVKQRVTSPARLEYLKDVVGVGADLLTIISACISTIPRERLEFSEIIVVLQALPRNGWNTFTNEDSISATGSSSTFMREHLSSIHSGAGSPASTANNREIDGLERFNNVLSRNAEDPVVSKMEEVVANQNPLSQMQMDNDLNFKVDALNFSRFDSNAGGAGGFAFNNENEFGQSLNPFNSFIPPIMEEDVAPPSVIDGENLLNNSLFS